MYAGVQLITYLLYGQCCSCKYSLVPNIRGVPNKRGGWFFFQKLISVAPPYFRDLKVFDIAILFLAFK